MKHLQIALSIICVLLGTQITKGQTRSSEIETINNQKYYIHTVQSKETFYGLSKLYDVSIDEIQFCNNNLRALTPGQKIRIPVVEKTQEVTYSDGEIISRNGIRYLVHIVKQGETVYAIARQYQTSAGQIIAANPTLSSNPSLAIDQQVFIPYTAELEKNLTEKKEQARKDSIVNYLEHWNIFNRDSNTNDTLVAEKLHSNLDITMLLPFFLDKNHVNGDEGIINNQQSIYEHSYQFLEYYEGVLMALDSIKKMGISVTLNVIESNNDSATANVNKIKTNTNMIIGPVFPKTFASASGFAKRHSIPIVNPLSQEETNILNPYVIHMNTPNKYRFKAMADYIANNNENCHVCIVYNSEQMEKKNLTQCKAAFNEIKGKLTAKQISFEDIYYPQAGPSGLDRALKQKPKTIVIVLSKQQAFANNIVTTLFKKSKEYAIELWGLPQWERYENLELDFLFDLNFKLVTNGETDYTNSKVHTFIEAYRERYNTEPTRFSFQGFDQMLYFTKHLAYDENMIENLQNAKESGIHETFQFMKTDGATINTATCIIEYDKNSFSRKTTHYTIHEE